VTAASQAATIAGSRAGHTRRLSWWNPRPGRIAQRRCARMLYIWARASRGRRRSAVLAHMRRDRWWVQLVFILHIALLCYDVAMWNRICGLGG
jgi:hypothetical protein